ncbi:MAG: N-acetylmuramoyl-L-alanine amidase [Armatimonadota bacterium]
MKKITLFITFASVLIFISSCPLYADSPAHFKILEPQGIVSVSPGDILNIKFQAPEGGRCSCSLTPYLKNAPTEEVSPGIYEASLGIPYYIRYLSSSDLFITYKDKEGGEISIKYPWKINYLTDPVPAVVKTTSDQYQLRAGPSTDYDRIAYMLKDTKFSVNKRIGDWFRLSTHPHGLWVNKEFLEITPRGTVPDYNLIKYITVKNNDKSADIIFTMTNKCAYSINSCKNSLFITFYNTASNILETRYDLHNNLIDEVTVLESAQNYVKFRADCGSKILWGYETDYNPENKKFTLKLRKPPADTSSLKDKVIILDAGHGGKDPGAVGPSGYTEKEANLEITLKLKEMLEESGAKVILTRKGDNELTPPDSKGAEELQARCDINKNNSGVIAVSIHNNSHPNEEKRKTLTNTDIYFYHSQSKLLADTIAKNTGKALNKENYFSLNRSFYLIRQTDSPSVLAEVTFISNPDEEKKLKDPAYRQKAALGIYNGIKEYFELSQ